MSDTAALAARIDELEIRLVHQDQIIEDLNAVIARQWNELEAVSRQLSKLGDRINVVETHSGEAVPAEPPPPHY